MKNARRGRGNRSRRLLIGSAVVLTLLLLLAAGGVYVTMARPDIGYGLWDTLFGKREPLALTEVDDAAGTADFRTVSLEAIRQGDEPGFVYQNSLWLVNAAHPLPEDAPLMLEEYRDTGLSLDRSLFLALQNLLGDAGKETGDKVYLMSAYRTREEQEAEYFQNPKLAAQAGTSEHQTGLALDVYVYQKAQREFITSRAGVWIQQHAHEYGFIIRYPFGKQSITGIEFEPWHLRYVGKPHAALMYANRWTLEDYIERLEKGTFYTAAGYVFTRQEAENGMLRVPSDWENVVVSADNTGSYILTCQE